jgi:hypothetical protein
MENLRVFRILDEVLKGWFLKASQKCYHLILFWVLCSKGVGPGKFEVNYSVHEYTCTISEAQVRSRIKISVFVALKMSKKSRVFQLK